MSLPEIHQTSRGSCLYSVLRIFLPIVLVLGIVAFLLYRTDIVCAQVDIAGRELEFTLLTVCILLLLTLFLIGSWRFVLAKTEGRILRSNLAQSEARLKSLFQTIPDLIWLKDVDGHYLNCNPAFERFFGKKEPEIIGRTDYDFVDAAQADAFRQNDHAALVAEEARVNEEWITFAEDGSRALLETIKIPVRTDDGQIIGVLGIARDITRRHEAEKEASMFRRLVEFSNDPVYVVDPADRSRMVFINQAACRHFGASQEEILQWHVTDWNPSITPADLAKIEERLKQEEGMVIETVHRVASGELVPVEVSINLLWHEGKAFCAGYIRDISERKRAEEALRKSHQQLVDLTSNIPGIVYQYRLARDGSFSFPFVGSTVEIVSGLSQESIYADPALPFSLMHPDDVEALHASILESMQTLRSWQHEFRVNLPKYGMRWLLAMAMPERQDDGATIFHGFITDITNMKRIEAELHQSREQLRQLVAYQDRIREDERKRIAREIHDELGQHLLALKIDVSMLAQIAADPSLFAERLKEVLQHIDVTVNNVRAIINNLRPSVLDLGLFAALEWQAKAFQRRSGIECELHGNEDDLPAGEHIATTLFRVMQEALTNVQRHASATRVSIELKRDGDHLVMTVADNGVGISDEEQSAGDGFGLLGIRERIAMLGGIATVENRGGTVLTISLPVELPKTPTIH
ncbi:MAG: multi-sensor signal transduction histidine kinase [Burkholderiaceae bacterium]|nr:multi-sensor signal transduction histidine kinase [Burkholderiaceae bacterium]